MKEKLTDIQHYLLALDLIYIATEHLSIIGRNTEGYVSLPLKDVHKIVCSGSKKLDDIYARLKNFFEAWQDRSAVEFDMTHKYRLEEIGDPKKQLDKAFKQLAVVQKSIKKHFG